MSSKAARLSAPDSPEGFLAFLRGYIDTPTSSSDGTLQQLQLIWGVKDCSRNNTNLGFEAGQLQQTASGVEGIQPPLQETPVAVS